MNILTFDIEEWFHILDNDSTRSEKEWRGFKSRIHSNMERIFNLLEKTQCKATFFCLGWIAEAYPEVIKEIHAKGFEIGTHGQRHQLVYMQSQQEFKSDLEYSVKLLEDLTGTKVKYFRAPGFSIREDNKWAFEIIASQGIEIDCSIFPALRAHGGFPSYRQPVPSILHYKGIELKELPINYTTIIGKPCIFTGGGYFRIYPYSLLKRWTKRSDYVMSYFHPRDFDSEQPMIKELPVYRKFKSYVGLRQAENKLIKWLTDFDFVDIKAASIAINWDNVKKVFL